MAPERKFGQMKPDHPEKPLGKIRHENQNHAPSTSSESRLAKPLFPEIGKELLQKREIQGFIADKAGQLASRSEKISDITMESRRLRLDAEKESESTGCMKWVVMTGYRTGKTVVEMIPGQFGPYGIGDVLTAVEGITGKELLGRKLDKVDRAISIAAAAIPLMPATPLRELLRYLRIRYEESAARNRAERNKQD